MALAFTIWLCGALPATALAFECRPHSIAEYATAASLIVFWPLALLAFVIALLRSEAH